MRNALSEPGCAHDQNQPCPDRDGPGDSCNTLTGRCETFDRDSRPHDGHRPKLHDADDEENRHQTRTALTTVEAEAQAVSPSRAGTSQRRWGVPGCLPAPGEVMRFPCGELEHASNQDDRTDCNRNGARQF